MADYYVATTGSDGAAGTIGAPFLTLQHAHDVAVAGDTILMRGGTYPVTQVTFTRDGSSGNTIKVFAYQAEIPILDGISATNVFSDIIYMNNASWWHFKGIEIMRSANIGMNIHTGSANNIVERCNVHSNGRIGSGGSGIFVSGTGGGHLFLNNDIHHNVNASTPGNSDGMAISGVSGTGIVVRGNRFWRNSDDGLDFWNSGPITAENNWSWENGLDDALQPAGGDGNGFKLGGAGAGDGGHTIRNNLAWRNLADGFDDNAADIAMFVYNNTACENSGWQYAFTSAVAHVLKNNIAVADGDISIHATVDDTFNSWNLGVTATNADFVSTDFSGATGARQSDGSLPVLNFLKLVSGSDLINAGTDVGLPFNGAAPDLGAYEFESVVAGFVRKNKLSGIVIIKGSTPFPEEYMQRREHLTPDAPPQVIPALVGGLGKRRMIFYQRP